MRSCESIRPTENFFLPVCGLPRLLNYYVARNDSHAPKPGTKTPPKKKRYQVVKGVVLYERYKSKPYCINKTIDKKQNAFTFATLEEAVEDLKAYKQAKVDAVSAKRQALATKRAADLAKHGGDSALERRVSDAFVKAWEDLTGRRAVVLNDGTTGDILLQKYKDGPYLVVQVKSTRKKGGNRYHFNGVCGYKDMPVFFFCVSDAIGWIIDGTKLDQRGKQYLYITPDTRLEQLVLAEGSMDDLVKYLDEHIDKWPSTTEIEARHALKSKEHAKELQGIDAYKARYPEETYEWPLAQNGHVDLGVSTCQFKTACVNGSQAGLKVTLHTGAGTDEGGKDLYDPYPVGAFEVLIVAYEEEKEGGTEWHLGRVPASELEERGYLSTPETRGTMSLTVYGPVGKQPDPNAYKKADTWTRKYYRL